MVQWLSSDINIFEPVFFSEGFESLSFYFLFFLFLTPSVGRLKIPCAVTNIGGSRRGSGGFGTDYFIFKGIFKKNERSSANGPPSLIYLNPLFWSRGSAFEQKGLCRYFRLYRNNQLKARVLTTHEGSSRRYCIRKLCMIVIIA